MEAIADHTDHKHHLDHTPKEKTQFPVETDIILQYRSDIVLDGIRDLPRKDTKIGLTTTKLMPPIWFINWMP